MSKSKEDYVVVLDEQYSDFKTRMVVWLVADYGLPYQNTDNYKRVVTLQISTNTAINYTTG